MGLREMKYAKVAIWWIHVNLKLILWPFHRSSCSLLLEPQVYPLEDKPQTGREKDRMWNWNCILFPLQYKSTKRICLSTKIKSDKWQKPCLGNNPCLRTKDSKEQLNAHLMRKYRCCLVSVTLSFCHQFAFDYSRGVISGTKCNHWIGTLNVSPDHRIMFIVQNNISILFVYIVKITH